MDLLGLDGLEGFDEDTPPVVSISASQSLNASAATRDPIATGLSRLDEALNDLPDQPNQGGILRGHVTEIFGPPGAGKTSLALNIACNALRDGKVVWIDTGSPLPSPRLEEMSVNLDDFIYFRAHTLAHLIALLARPPKGFPPSETNLIVVDSVSNLFPAYFPSAQELKDQLAEGKITDKAHLQWLLNRKWNIASELATHLAKLAARNIAVLAINQSHTKIKPQSHAVLQPLLSGSAWEASVQTRIAVYRDLPDERFVEVEKRAGKPLPEQAEELLVAFRIEPDGLYETEGKESLASEPLTPLVKPPPDFEYYDPPTPTPSPISSVLSSAPPSPELKSPSPLPSKPMSPEQPVQTPNKKRKVEEVADSQDEDSEEEDVPWTAEATLNTNQS
ncbi:DNA recombination and repair protein Rad51, C-terminal [Penicillium expansum]|uniref:DNA recombination and repair protein Rad51, C-terminal n=1 Tax=Penicillium expansum TaxID=27334 RepID=A0A0A2L2I3_PENEN|nr:DNA recombination and repair protein Rad51, C-terminal [Penicillium expansum]KGO46053.1 DNA recombination and repair protein Rad51, C-terminal [Penicillium expansum]KGO61137.1 DNA recombination and repair protein Rad51, C-terminal [Penicillium expansum]KGO70810.1 DNA recombination and repair protein Rad51, C-terminal [Penicillium expansum]